VLDLVTMAMAHPKRLPTTTNTNAGKAALEPIPAHFIDDDGVPDTTVRGES
jgi:hypothetical protein